MIASVRAAPPPTRIGPVTFRWGEQTFVMGIINVTPDSFSGDGLLASEDALSGSEDPVAQAVEQARRMAAEGADLLVVGRGLLELRYVGAEVGDLGHDVKDAVHPELLIAQLGAAVECGMAAPLTVGPRTPNVVAPGHAAAAASACGAQSGKL